MGREITNPVLYAQQHPDKLAIQDLDRRYTTYAYKEIYNGVEEDWKLYVPNVDDKVEDWDTNAVYRVIAVDDRTKLSTLKLIGQLSAPFDGQGDETTTFEGIDPTWSYDTWRVLINTNTIPATMNIDRRFHLHGSDIRRIAVFRGSDISAKGEIISAMYDNSGNKISDFIPCQLIAYKDGTNKAIWAPREGYCIKPVEDFEQVMVVGYGDGPQPLSMKRMIVRITDYVRTPDQGIKYILEDGVRLKSTWLSSSDTKLLELPINVNLDSVDLQAEVTYSDGSIKHWPVTGNKVVLDGLNVFTSQVINSKHPLALHYYLDDDEDTSYALPGAVKHISVPYTVVSKEAKGAYSVKLFCYPQWVSDAVGYELVFWLYNVDRERYYNVTDKVQLALNSPEFNPKKYGQPQEFAYNIWLDEVDPTVYKRVRHTQTIRMTLLQAGSATSGDYWTVTFSSQTTPTTTDVYGRNTKALFTYDVAGNAYVDLTNKHSDLGEWLNQLYYPIHPLYLEKTESKAPEPTHFEIMVGPNVQKRFEISQWNRNNNVPGGTGQDNANLYIRWIKVQNGVDLHLGITAVVISKVA